jgi:hypothetical protein
MPREPPSLRFEAGTEQEGAPVPIAKNTQRRRVRHQHARPFDHCGGNRLLRGMPIHVQRLDLQPHRNA